MTEKRLCFCQWSDCKKFRQIILDKASNDHPWSSGIVRLTFPQKKNTNPSKKSISWQVSICRHLLINNLDNDIPGRIDIYPHHFPLALLKWRQHHPKVRWNTPIQKNDAYQIANYDYGNKRFMEYTNSMYYMLSKSSYNKEDKSQMLLPEYKKLFHQSPMTTKNELVTFVNNLNRDSKVIAKLQTQFDIELTSEMRIKKESDLSSGTDTTNNQQSGNESISSDSRNLSKEKSVPILSGLGIGLGLSSIQINMIQTVTPPLIPSIATIREYLIKKYASLQRCSITFHKSKSVAEMARLLSVYHDSNSSFIISPSDKMRYYPCKGYNLTSDRENCNFFSLMVRDYDTILCYNCQTKKSLELRKRKRTTDNKTRARPFGILNQEEKVLAYEQRNKKMRTISKKYQRLVNKLQNVNESLTIHHNTPVSELFKKVFKYLSENWKFSTLEINKLVLELNLGTKNNTDNNIEERKECTKYLCENIENMKHKLKGQGGLVRYSAHTVNIALSLFLRNKRGYDDLRSSGLLCLPSPQILSRKASKLKVRPGGDPSIYLSLQDEISESNDDIIGHVMMDEIKLKNGITYNCKSKEIVSFLPEEMNTKNMLESILGINKKHKNGEVLSVYANQWRFRSTKGLVHNSDFYFNNGSLCGNELVR